MSEMKGVKNGFGTDWDSSEAEGFYKKLFGLDKEYHYADPQRDWTVERAERSKSLGGLEYSTEYIKLYNLLSRCRSCKQWKKETPCYRAYFYPPIFINDLLIKSFVSSKSSIFLIVSSKSPVPK